MADPVSAVVIGSIVSSGIGMMGNKPEKPKDPPIAPPPVTQENPNVQQSAMMRKARLSQASRAKSRKQITYKDTLAKGGSLG